MGILTVNFVMTLAFFSSCIAREFGPGGSNQSLFGVSF